MRVSSTNNLFGFALREARFVKVTVVGEITQEIFWSSSRPSWPINCNKGGAKVISEKILALPLFLLLV